jgi:hypothetical protein
MAYAASTTSVISDYTTYVNPRWTTLLNLLEMNVKYDRCLLRMGGAFSIISPGTAFTMSAITILM